MYTMIRKQKNKSRKSYIIDHFTAIILCLFQFFRRGKISFTENAKLSFNPEINLLFKELCLFVINRKNIPLVLLYFGKKMTTTHTHTPQ